MAAGNAGNANFCPRLGFPGRSGTDCDPCCNLITFAKHVLNREAESGIAEFDDEPFAKDQKRALSHPAAGNPNDL
jgi:hypothetical protein